MHAIWNHPGFFGAVEKGHFNNAIMIARYRTGSDMETLRKIRDEIADFDESCVRPADVRAFGPYVSPARSRR